MKFKNYLVSCLFLILFILEGFSQNTFYVSPYGSDDNQNDGLSTVQPFKTIKKALEMIPKCDCFDSYPSPPCTDEEIAASSEETILLMEGEYFEQVNIAGYCNLKILPEGSGEVILNGSHEAFAKGIAPEDSEVDLDGWEVVDPDNDDYIRDEYFGNQIIYKTHIPQNMNLANASKPNDYKFNWLFRVLENGETEQIYGYFNVNSTRDGNGDPISPCARNPVDDSGIFFSSRLAENRNGVGYMIKDLNCPASGCTPYCDPTTDPDCDLDCDVADDPNCDFNCNAVNESTKVLYVAVNPDDDFIANGTKLHYSKSGAIIRFNGCNNCEFNGGASKLIKLRYSGRYGIVVNGRAKNLTLENLDFKDVRTAIEIQSYAPENVVIRNNKFTHIVDVDYDYPWTDVKANIIESSAITNNGKFFTDEVPMDNTIIEGNEIYGYFNGIQVVGFVNPNNSDQVSGFTTIANNRLEEIGDDAIELEGTVVGVNCYGNFVKNAFAGVSLIVSEIGPIYIHENVFTTSRKLDRFRNAITHTDIQYSHLKPIKFGSTCASADSAETNIGNCLSMNVHFYHNSFAMTGAALEMSSTPNSPWKHPKNSTFFNNVFYSSDGPCTEGAGNNCTDIVLRGNLFYTKATAPYVINPDLTRENKYTYWGGGGSGNNLNDLDQNRAALPCVTPENDWMNNEERMIDFVTGIGGSETTDFYLSDECFNWTLETLPDHYPPLINQGRTLPGALEKGCNDECVDAISIQANDTDECAYSYHYSTESATLSPNSSCFGSPNDDIWFSFEAVSDIHRINITNASEEMIYAIYEDCDDNLVSCNGWNGFITLEYVANLIIGETYWLRIYTKDAEVFSDFDLCINTLSLPNDECSGAISILANEDESCTHSYTFSTEKATLSWPLGCVNNASSDDDIWFSFEAVSKIHEIEITNTSQSMIYALYNDCGYQLFSCNGWNGTQTLPYVRDLVIGQTYWLRIYTRSSGVHSDFNLCIKGLNVENDDCTDAISILVNKGEECTQTYSGTTVYGTSSELLSCVNNIDVDDDVWFLFEASSTDHQINITNASQSMIYMIYDACDGNIVSCNGWNETQTLPYVEGLIIGDIYLLRIYTGLTGVFTDFDLCINTPDLGSLMLDGNPNDQKEINVLKPNTGKLSKSLLIYPNPAFDNCTIDFRLLDRPMSIQVVDVKGSILYQDRIENKEQQEVDLTNFPEGILFIKVQDANSIFIEKILHAKMEASK